MNNLPFSLDDLNIEYHYIEIYPRRQNCLALTKAKSLATATKIMQALQLNSKDNTYGLNLAKNNGLLVAERLSLKNSQTRREAIANYLELLGKVHNETKIPIKELEGYFAEPLKHTDKIGRYLGEISDVSLRLDGDADNVTLITTLVKQRLIPSWAIEDTESLHEEIYNQLLEYANQEQKRWSNEEEEDEGEQLPGEAMTSSSSEELENSENSQQELTGAEYTTTY